jgi:hypothetical protein
MLEVPDEDDRPEDLDDPAADAARFASRRCKEEGNYRPKIPNGAQRQTGHRNGNMHETARLFRRFGADGVRFAQFAHSERFHPCRILVARFRCCGLEVCIAGQSAPHRAPLETGEHSN